jgi:MFS family permease
VGRTLNIAANCVTLITFRQLDVSSVSVIASSWREGSDNSSYFGQLGEFPLRPSSERREAEAPASETIDPSIPRPLRHPIKALLRLRALDSLRYREFRLIWYGQVFASMATWMDSVARGWLIYELTNSSFQLGLVRGVQALPILLLSPIAGSTADLYSRKMQVMIAQIVDGLLYAAVALLILTGEIQAWHVYATSIGLATVQTFQQPSRASMISDAVPSGSLINAIGLNAIVFNVARTGGPALAGVLIAVFGTAGSYSVQAIFFFLATFWTVKLRAESRLSAGVAGHSGNRESFSRSVIEGWKFSWRNHEVRTGLLVVTFASLLLIPFSTLLPVFARDILVVGAKGQGLLLTSMGVGALLSSVLVASLGDRMPRGIVMIGGVGIYGVLVVIFSASSSFVLSIAVMAMIGLCHVTSHALVQTVIQAYSPPEFRGRTMAIFHMTQVVLVVGAMLIGALSTLVGARWAAASMSILGTLTMIAIYVLMPRAREIR